MYPTDPTLYGATLPQREFPVTAPYAPFFGQNLPMQVPWQQPYMWQNFQRFVPPMYQGFQPPMHQGFQPPYIKEPYGQIPPYLKEPYGQVPPYFRELYGQIPPYFKELYGQIPPYMIPPQFQGFQGFQKPFFF
jgi:hypothetical protein